MRNTFAKEINSLAQKNKNIVLLSGDIGNRMFDELKKSCPNQFINCGIAEANMMSMAAGMGISGLRPIIYTITPFTTARCFEQIKIGVGYHKSPVIIVGTGSGLSYAELGPTHHSLDDIAILKTIPELNILAPADSIELKYFLNQAVKLSKPTYIRIGKKGEPDLTSKKNRPLIGKANILTEGSDILIIGIGPILEEATKAANVLKEHNVSTSVVSMGSIRPLDQDFLNKASEKGYKHWITLEEHGLIGGLGSSILEWIAETKLNKELKLHRLGLPTKFINKLGDQAYMRGLFNLDTKGIVEFILNL